MRLVASHRRGGFRNLFRECARYRCERADRRLQRQGRVDTSGAVEAENGIDDDCNGLADDVDGVPSSSSADNDNDASTIEQGDCNGHDMTVHAGLVEVPNGRVDNDCDGLATRRSTTRRPVDTTDHDGDGYPMSNDRVYGDAFEAA